MTTNPRTPCAVAANNSALAVSFQNGDAQGVISFMFVFCTWVTFGIKPQRSTSAKLIWLRAPMINAPMIASRINPYIASAVRRVNSHMNISKFRPRFERGKVLDLVVAMLTSRRADDHEDGNRVKRNKDCPLHPNGFLLIGDQSRD